MAVTNTVGATKYGIQLTFRNANTQTDSTKSYNGLNFLSEAATDRAAILQTFLYGFEDDVNSNGLVDVVQSMNSGYSIEGAALTVSNPVTFVET